jgi:hypothetical protein
MTPYEKHFMLWLIAFGVLGAYAVALIFSWRLKLLSKRAEFASGVAAIVMLIIGLGLVHYAPPHPIGHRSSAWADGLSAGWTQFSLSACLASKALIDKTSRHVVLLSGAGSWLFLAIMMSLISVQVANGH